MKVIATSDLHGFLPQIPECDLLLIAGDVCPVWNHRIPFQRKWLREKFAPWLESIPARKIVGVWGNHDLIAEMQPGAIPDLPWTNLLDGLIEWEGLRIYGLPWQLRFFDWAFNLDQSDLVEKYRTIPDCDIIVSHGPPLGFGDLVQRDQCRVGSGAFLQAIDRIQPQLAVYGHIHCDPGVWRRGVTTLANVSLLNDAYRVANPIYEFEVSVAAETTASSSLP